MSTHATPLAAAPAEPPPPPPPRRRRRYVLGTVLALCAFVGLVVVLIVAAYVALGTQRALDYVVQRAMDRSEDHLVIEGATGSLLSTVLVDRIAWNGEGMNVEAREIALTWSPWDLLSRKFIVQGLGAKQLSLEFKPSEGTGTGLPPSLAVPLEVDVRSIGVQRLDWRTATQNGFVSGITFGYAGGAREHAIRDMRFVTEWGTLDGNARLAALPPYAIDGALTYEGDGTYQGGRAALAASGTLEELGIAAKGTWRNADVSVKAGVTPFAHTILTTADIEAQAVDLAQFMSNLPTTALSLRLRARPEGTGFAGSLDARNEAPGPIDAGRVPATALASRFAWDGSTLALTGIDARLGERGSAGRASGSVTVATGGGPVRLDLTLASVDLSKLLTTLISTHLSGTLAADVEETRQVVQGNLRQDDIAVDFAATIAQRRVTVQRMSARAGTGTLTGRGTLALDDPRSFTVDVRASGFDPSRFVAMPAAKLHGTLVARGTLTRPFALHGEVAVTKGSRFAGLDIAGTGAADVAPASVRNAKFEATLGATRVTLTGAFGAPADSLAYDVDIGKLAELRPLIERYAPATASPEVVAGSLRARGKVTGDPAAPGVTVDAHAANLVWGTLLRAATLDVAGSFAPGRNAAGPVPLAARPVTLKATATKLAVPQLALASASASVEGTLDEHKATIAAKGADIDLAATATGGVTDVKHGNATEKGWSGTLETFANKGTYAVTLNAPAPLGAAPHRTELGSASITVVDGRVDIARVLVEDGRISTQGRFTSVPVAAVARLMGRPLPFHSTLVLGGEWAIAATPRLNGSFTLHRERGDWFAAGSTTLGAADFALGITALELSARFTDDALAATARFRSARAGTGDASFNLAAGIAPGRIEASAPFTASITADLASLRPLQPWLGTVAVMDGRLHVNAAGRGTLEQPVLAGNVAGDALRFDLPQYGVHLRDGALRARLVDRAVVLEDLSFAGGDGRFTATGTIARPTQAEGAPASRVQWQAENFTIVNRPDLRLVADGKGTLAFENGKVLLGGNVSIDEGRVEYEPTRVGRLSDDVVIVGDSRRTDNGDGPLPLALDLEVALGRDFRFSGEGLDTRLAGRVKLVTTAAGRINAAGTIRAVTGTYRVFGQRLDIDRGRLIFDGPVDNPALDVVALRRNLAVEAGVELSGTVRQPRVRLVSNPPVPDGEKLSWLLTGQGLDRASRGDFALLGAASASLLGGGNRPITTQIANTIGLDDISVRGSDSAVTGGASTQVLAFGKRITDRLTLVYEQGLTVATNALRIEYALSRTLTLRAEAGVVSSVGLFFRRSFD